MRFIWLPYKEIILQNKYLVWKINAFSIIKLRDYWILTIAIPTCKPVIQIYNASISINIVTVNFDIFGELQTAQKFLSSLSIEVGRVRLHPMSFSTHHDTWHSTHPYFFYQIPRARNAFSFIVLFDSCFNPLLANRFKSYFQVPFHFSCKNKPHGFDVNENVLFSRKFTIFEKIVTKQAMHIKLSCGYCHRLPA